MQIEVAKFILSLSLLFNFALSQPTTQICVDALPFFVGIFTFLTKYLGTLQSTRLHLII